jgi:tripartite ATP-independent transporter DctM subunit
MQDAQPLTLSKNPVWRVMNHIEHYAGFAMLMVLALIPVLDALLRTFLHSGVPYGANFLDAMFIPLTFLGIALASKENRHLSIAVNVLDREGRLPGLARGLVSLVNGLVAGVFFWNCSEFIINGFNVNESVFFIPIAVFLAFFPFGMFLVVLRSYPRRFTVSCRLVYLSGLLLSVAASMGSIVPILQSLVGLDPALIGLDILDDSWWRSLMLGARLPLVGMLLLTAFLGAPLFIVLGGIAMFLFAGEGMAATFALSDGYQQLKSSSMPAIALFTFAGYLLSESNACKRMIHLFQGLLGRLPGGIIVVTVIISAFFTSFTGGSGITLLALGAILLAILKDSGGNSESFSVGLITSTGAIGLLFPPSLAIIIYGAVEMSSLGTSGAMPANILQIFEGALLPGLIFVLAMVVMGAILAHRERGKRHVALPPRMSKTELRHALADSALELLLPVLVIVVFFTGVAGIVESAAFAALYALVVEVFIKKEIGFRKLVELAGQTLIIFGGILAILTFGRGLSSYVVYVGFDQALVDWAQATIRSPWLFLLLVTVLLLVAGCLMDIYTAIVIFVPLLTLVAASFGISQTHLAAIFLANMSIGFMTPPVGMDLFLASFRFQRPLTKIYRDVLPFLGIQLVALALVTYVPWFSTVLVK